MCSLDCAGCGRPLLREQHAAAPTPWFAHEGVMSVTAARLGWVQDRCPDCQREEDQQP